MKPTSQPPPNIAALSYDELARKPIAEQVAALEQFRERAIDGLPEPTAEMAVIQTTAVLRYARALLRTVSAETKAPVAPVDLNALSAAASAGIAPAPKAD